VALTLILKTLNYKKDNKSNKNWKHYF